MEPDPFGGVELDPVKIRARLAREKAQAAKVVRSRRVIRPLEELAPSAGAAKRRRRGMRGKGQG